VSDLDPENSTIAVALPIGYKTSFFSITALWLVTRKVVTIMKQKRTLLIAGTEEN
jgi:hypothetical protein